MTPGPSNRVVRDIMKPCALGVYQKLNDEGYVLNLNPTGAHTFSIDIAQDEATSRAIVYANTLVQ